MSELVQPTFKVSDPVIKRHRDHIILVPLTWDDIVIHIFRQLSKHICRLSFALSQIDQLIDICSHHLQKLACNADFTIQEPEQRVIYRIRCTLKGFRIFREDRFKAFHLFEQVSEPLDLIRFLVLLILLRWLLLSGHIDLSYFFLTFPLQSLDFNYHSLCLNVALHPFHV